METNEKYKTCIVAFLDILGFKNKIKLAKENQEINEIFQILNYVNAWNTKDGVNLFIEEKDVYDEVYIKKLDIDFSRIQKELQITYFSDSLVISLPFENDTFEERLFLIIHAIAYLISKLSLSNYFIRGGISTGNFFHEDNIFFGPAFLEAYKLESEVAIYPRVILDDHIISKIKDNNLPYIKKMNDGIYSIDWIPIFKKINPLDFNNKIIYLRDIIKANSESNDIKIRAKYKWLKNYIDSDNEKL